MTKQVAIIVSNYNCKEYLKDCFESLFEQTYKNFEIYLLDNASTDDSVSYASKFFPSVKILAMKKNYGFAEGYNRAIAQINSEYIAILNSDTKVSSAWLENLLDSIEADIAIVGSKIYFFDKPQVINSAGQKLTFAGFSFDIGFGYKDGAGFNKKKFVGSVCGASLLIKRDIFLNLGGFDKDYFLFCEDTDLCWRVWLNGYKVLYEPSSCLLHKFGAQTGKRETPLRIFYSQRNAIITVIKNMGVLRLISSLIIIAAYTIVRLFIYVLGLKKKNIRALLEATFSVLPLLKTTLSKRKIVQAERKIPDRFLEQNGLIASLKETINEYLRISLFKNYFVR